MTRNQNEAPTAVVEIPVWGEKVPFNSPRKKAEDMVRTRAPRPLVILHWIQWVFGKKIRRDNHGHDDYLARVVIPAGRAKETYEDIPVILPFLAEHPKGAVVIAPGGGFCDRMEDTEGIQIARLCNEYGYSGFVLKYRLEPYRFPIPCLDMQRAIRFLRVHAAEYGIEDLPLGSMGFSAGGYTAAGAAVLLGDDPVAAEGYEPDAVDAACGMPDFVCAIYPVVSFDVNPCMLANLTGPEFYTDPAKRARWQKVCSLAKNLDRAPFVPQFLAYGTRDLLGGFEEYAAQLLKRPEQNEVLVLEGAGHGFAHQKEFLHWQKACFDWIGRQQAQSHEVTKV